MSSIEIFNVVANMLGGLALFLYGMSLMSDSLSAMSGGILDNMMGWVTKNRFTAFLFGAVLTAIVQSASAISVLTVGLVNSGIIVLEQGLGLLIGANLGTTATAWLLSLNALDGESLLMTIIKPSSFTPFLAIISVAVLMFAKKGKTIGIANAVLGFSVMMIGMTLMSRGVEPLEELPVLQKILMSFSNPLLGFLFAAFFTMLIQSSDATVGIVMAFALSMDVTFGTVIPLLCGAQVGTCVTALLSSLGASNSGKRTALMNLYYNLLKVVPFMLLFYGANSVLHFSFLANSVGGIGIPICHTLINLFGAALWLPSGNLIINLARKTVPYSELELREQENRLTMLDKNLVKNPPIALNQTDRAVVILAEAVGQAMRSLVEDDSGEESRIILERIEQYRTQVDRYLAEVSAHTFDTRMTSYVLLLTNVNNAFGEMGVIADVFRTLIGRFKERMEDGSVEAADQTVFYVMGESAAEILDMTIYGYEQKDAALAGTIQVFREEMTGLNEVLKKRLLRRTHRDGMNEETKLFTGISRTLESFTEHCDIVADALISYNRLVVENSNPHTSVDQDKIRRQVHKLFMDKYQMLKIDLDEEGRAVDRME